MLAQPSPPAGTATPATTIADVTKFAAEGERLGQMAPAINVEEVAAEAEGLFRKTLAARKKTLAEENPAALTNTLQLARLLLWRGAREAANTGAGAGPVGGDGVTGAVRGGAAAWEAQALLATAVPIMTRVFGAEHPTTVEAASLLD
jgi:hypothetical protein